MFFTRASLVTLVFIVSINYVSGQDDDNVFTSDELEAIDKLRNLVGDAAFDDYKNKGFTIIHFLRAKNLNAESTNRAILEAIEWRKTNRIDNIENETLLPGIYPYQVRGVDRKDRPVVYLSIPRWDVRGLILSGKRNDLQRYFIRFLEITHSRILRAGNSTENAVTQATCIVDAEGYNLRQHACIQCISLYLDWMRTYFRYYIQDFGHIIWLNVPRIAHPVVEILKVAMDPQMRKALKVYASDKQELKSELSKIIRPSQLLIKYGGELK